MQYREVDYEVKSLPNKVLKNKYQELLQEYNLDHLLAKNGYEPLILYSLPEEQNHYLKCFNRQGQEVIVQIDKIGNIYDEIKQIKLYKSNKPIPLAYSLKQGLFKTIHPLIHTLFFEFGHYGFSLISLDNKQEFIEASYQLLDKAHEALGNEQLSQFKVLPVLLLTEILTDESEITNHCQKSHHLLHNKLYEIVAQKYDQHDKILDKLSSEFSLFDNLHRETTIKLKEIVTLLEKWNQYYLLHPPRFDEEKENALKIKRNLIDRHNLVQKILQAVNTMTAKKEEIKNILHEVQELNKYYGNEFQEVEMVIE